MGGTPSEEFRMDFHNTDDSLTRRVRVLTDRVALARENDLYYYNQPI